jgi:hypothetical protein
MITEFVQLYDTEIEQFKLLLLDVNEAITQNGGAGIYAKNDFIVTHAVVKLHTIAFVCSKKNTYLCNPSGD